jgi:soluble lytic murein transglycosylase-like protein
MQLLPATASTYGVTDIMDPRQNIQAGTKYLKDLLVSNQGNLALALAAYNAGPGNVSRHNNRIPSYSETMLYVPKVLARMAFYRTEDLALER